MRVRLFETEQWLPWSPSDLFPFFADATNLEKLTPPWLHFQIVPPTPLRMQQGTQIDYRLRIRGLPVRWRTLISVWEPPHRFVDEQLRGPYRLWVHEHLFEAWAGGTWVRDRVQYAVPFDACIHRWWVRPDIERIFRYRARVLQELFGRVSPSSGDPA